MFLVEKSVKSLPFPYFSLNSSLDIMSVSEETLNHFPPVSNFMDLIDYGSRNKAKKFLNSKIINTKVELNLMTHNQPMALYDVYLQWTNEQLNVFCIEKEESVQQIQSIVQRLEQQFTNENLTLSEKKEELESTIKKMEHIVMHHDNLSNLGRLASSIADELKRPLVSIKGFIQLLKPSLIELGKEQYVNIALEELDRANNILYQFLSASNPPEPDKTQINIQKTLSEVIESVRGDAKRCNCEIKYQKEQILPVMQVDVKQFKQVVLNLLKNAMEAVKVNNQSEEGIILVKTELTETTVDISIKDNGKGMDSETKKMLFTPFYTTKEKRAGIGLAVSSNIIKNHDGVIKVSSERDKGSTFVISLPINSQEI